MAGGWFSPGTPVSPTNKTDCHDITDILLKVAYELPYNHDHGDPCLMQSGYHFIYMLQMKNLNIAPFKQNFPTHCNIQLLQTTVC